MLGAKPMMKMILIGAGFGILYWGINSAIMAFVLHSGSFVEQFFQPDVHHLWMRIPTVVLLISVVPIISKLRKTRTEVKTLSGLLPICAWCKKIRDDEGYWKDVEQYISEHTKVELTHSICPKCFNKTLLQEASKENNNSKVN